MIFIIGTLKKTGFTKVKIGNEVLEREATVSATVLYFLKTLTEDHLIYEDNPMLPCCGLFILKMKQVEMLSFRDVLMELIGLCYTKMEM